MKERVENDVVRSDIRHSNNDLARVDGWVDTGVGFCADISARDEAPPKEQPALDKASQTRGLVETLGSTLGSLITEVAELKTHGGADELRKHVDELRQGQENLQCAGYNVDELYVRIIKLERSVEQMAISMELLEKSIQRTQRNLDKAVNELVREDEVYEMVGDIVPEIIDDFGFVDNRDFNDAVIAALRNNIQIVCRLEEQ